jgi:hypothetical protein
MTTPDALPLPLGAHAPLQVTDRFGVVPELEKLAVTDRFGVVPELEKLASVWGPVSVPVHARPPASVTPRL